MSFICSEVETWFFGLSSIMSRNLLCFEVYGPLIISLYILHTNGQLCCGCLSWSNEPGCSSDSECTSEICAADSYCCDSRWDSLCATTAYKLCYPTTLSPSTSPTSDPSRSPSTFPSSAPSPSPTTHQPSRAPITQRPSRAPTLHPTSSPSAAPSVFPTNSPTHSPTREPTLFPTVDPTMEPTTSSPTLQWSDGIESTQSMYVINAIY